MRFYLLLALFCAALFAKDIQITSDKFYANQNTLISTFTGHVTVTDAGSNVKADKIQVFFTKEKKPIKFVATGGVKAFITTKEGRKFEASAAEMILYPNTEKIELKNNAVITEVNTKNKITGSTVIFNKKSGEAEVYGSANKPVRFTIEVDEK